MSSRARTNVVVLACAVYAFFALTAPARGLAFFQDDWENLHRVAHGAWPGRWLGLVNEHWKPIFLAWLELEWRIFGTWHDAYLATTCAIHALNLLLLARLLHARTGSERAAAIGVAVFGLSTHWRDVLWWAELGGLALSFTFTALGLLAIERWRATRSGRWLATAAAATIAAPLSFGSGLALGPALLVETWLLDAGPHRRRALAAVGLAWAAYVAAYVPLALSGAPRMAPRDLGELAVAARFAVDAVGAGMVGEALLLPPAVEPPAGSWLLAALYAAAVVAVARRAPPGRALRLVAVQVHLACLVAPVALTRWFFWLPTLSRYQYLVAIPWATTVALALGASPGRRTARAAVAVVALLGVGHALAARSDRSLPTSPALRRHHPALLARLRRVLSTARGPVHDVRLPPGLAHESTHACVVLTLWAPDLVCTYTNVRSDETVRLYAEDPVLRELLAIPPPRPMREGR